MKYLLLSFIFISQYTSSQEYAISGTVSDTSDKTVIVGARVIVTNTNSGVYTDAKGNFLCKNLKSGTYVVDISCLGYAQQRKTIVLSPEKSTAIVDVVLVPVVSDLETVVITGTRTEKRLKEVPVLTQIIVPARMREAGITTVGGALEREVPGFDFATFNSHAKVTFQGMNAQYLLFLVDGERMAGEMEGNIDYSRLNLDDVDQIEIVRGASSVLYGSNAMGGVINIITKKQQNPFDAAISTRYSKYNEFTSSALMGLKSNFVSSRTNITVNETDGYDLTPSEKATATQEPYQNIAFSQRFQVKPTPNMVVTASGNAFYNRIYDGHIKPVDHSYSGLGGYIKSNYTLNNANAIELTYATDEYIAYEVYPYINDKHNKYTSDDIQNFKASYISNSVVGQVITGVENFREHLYSTRILNQYRNGSEIIAFVQDDYKLTDQISFVAGFRGTRHSQYGFNFVPKASCMFKLSPFIFRLSYGMGYRSPSLKELYYDFDHLGMFRLIGNAGLKPEKSHYVGFSTEIDQDKANHTVNVYYNAVNNMIVGTWIDAKTNQYVNIATATVIGVDVLEKVMPIRNVVIGMGISLVDARNNLTGNQIYGVSPVSANASANYSVAYGALRTSFEVSGKYNGRREYEPIGAEYYIDKPYNTWRFTATESYKTKCSVTVGVDNILNQTDPKSFDFTSPGRRFFVSANWRFSKY